MFCSLADALLRIHKAGGTAIVPHPLSYLTFSIGEGALRELAAYGDDARMVDAIEIRNPSYAGRVRASRAAWLNTHVLRVAETGSSDAHHAALVGTCWTDFPGSTPDDLRAALRGHATAADGRGWTLREHLDGAATQQWRPMVRAPLNGRGRRRTSRGRRTSSRSGRRSRSRTTERSGGSRCRSVSSGSSHACSSASSSTSFTTTSRSCHSSRCRSSTPHGAHRWRRSTPSEVSRSRTGPAGRSVIAT